MPSEKRRSQRIEINEPVTINWQSERGDTLSLRGTLLNLGDHGALVRTTERLPSRLLVQLIAPSWNIDTSATVRHSSQRGMHVFIGFELNSPLAAKPNRQRWT